MTTRVPIRLTLTAAVAANNGTLTVAYPSGYTQADFTGANALAEGRVVLNDNDVLHEPGQVGFSYGAGSVVLTNKMSFAWPVGTQVLVVLAGGQAQVAPGGGGGASIAQVLAALGEAVGEGNAAIFEDGEWSGLPLIEGVVATSWDILTGLAEGLSDQGSALKAWQEALGVGEVDSGVVTFLWPADEDGLRNRTGYQRVVVGVGDDDNGAVSILVPSRPTEIGDVEQVLTLTFEIENSTGDPLTVDLAGEDEGRETVEWAAGSEALEVADGDAVRVHVNLYPGVGLAHSEVVAP